MTFVREDPNTTASFCWKVGGATREFSERHASCFTIKERTTSFDMLNNSNDNMIAQSKPKRHPAPIDPVAKQELENQSATSTQIW